MNIMDNDYDRFDSNLGAGQDSLYSSPLFRNSATERLDNEIVVLLADDNSDFSKIEAAIQKIEAFLHQDQQKITKEIGRAAEQKRKVQVVALADSYRGKVAFIISVGIGAACFAQAVGNAAPAVFHSGAVEANRVLNLAGRKIGIIEAGRLDWLLGSNQVKVFDIANLNPAKAEDLQKIAERVSKIFESGVNGGNQVKSVWDNREQANRTEPQSEVESARSEKERLNTENQQVGQRRDAILQNIQQTADKKKQAFDAMTQV